MPKAPKLLDFFPAAVFRDYLPPPAAECKKTALDAGQDEKVVIGGACCMIFRMARCLRTEHGYWSAQIGLRPMSSEEVGLGGFSITRRLRYFARRGRWIPKYPECLQQTSSFGTDYEPPEYIQTGASGCGVRNRWYMKRPRLITIYRPCIRSRITGRLDPEMFTDVIGRNFKEPKEGLRAFGRFRPPRTCGEP